MSRVFAPRNPLIEVARFYFVPRAAKPRVSNGSAWLRPQNVLVVAEMNDGALLMTKTWVEWLPRLGLRSPEGGKNVHPDNHAYKCQALRQRAKPFRSKP